MLIKAKTTVNDDAERKGDDSIAGYAMQWITQSEEGRRAGRPRTTRLRAVEEECKLP